MPGQKKTWAGGFKTEVVSKPGSTVRVTKVDIPKPIREAISESLRAGKTGKKGE